MGAFLDYKSSERAWDFVSQNPIFIATENKRRKKLKNMLFWMPLLLHKFLAVIKVSHGEETLIKFLQNFLDSVAEKMMGKVGWGKLSA